ncbi:MAG: hypothetical protein RR532_08320 [Erysipelothrix sp.]
MPVVINAKNRTGIVAVFQKSRKLPNGEGLSCCLNEERAPVVIFADQTTVSFTWDDIIALAIVEKKNAQE